MLDDVDAYVDSWARSAHRDRDAFHWQADVHPDELEYLTNSLYNLDMRLADQGPCGGGAEPAAGRAFHVALVEALLFALAQDGPSRAAFAEELRPSWSVVARSA